MFTVNKNPSPRELRMFAVGMLFVPVILILILGFWRRRQPDESIAAIWLALAISLSVLGAVAGLFTLTVPTIGRRLYITWMTVTLPIGVAMSTLLLTVLYFVLLPIFAIIVRRQDPLRKKLGGATYWEDYRPHEPTIERMRRPF